MTLRVSKAVVRYGENGHGLVLQMERPETGGVLIEQWALKMNIFGDVWKVNPLFLVTHLNGGTSRRRNNCQVVFPAS